MVAAQQEVKQKEQRERRPSFWDQFAGKRMVFQTRGRIIITGTFREFAHGLLILDKPTIKGVRVKVQPPEVFLAREQVGHFHEECEQSKVE
jgi:hypothetical protein